ncbi:MAG: LLM class flavin-dependent oxidoreductase [Armatimonadota bacterium]|nr:LLM class flavin-dependent oxidoreductase [Armatimonadota bacterium]
MARVRAGIAIVPQYPPSRLRNLARLVEDLGYGSFWVADEGLHRNVYVTLSHVAIVTKHLQLGTGVTNPYTRHPALTAAAIATLDELSGGRAVLGLGAGGSATAALGVMRIHPAHALREAVEIIHGLTAGGRVDFRGKVFTFSGALDFTPLRRVPVYIAARGPRSLEVAGEVADGVIVGGLVGPRGLAYCVDAVGRGVRRVSRAPGTFTRVAWIYAATAPRAEDAQRAVARTVALSLIASQPVVDRLGMDLPGDLRDYLDRHQWHLHPEVIDCAATLLDSRVYDEFAVTGDSDTCAGRLAALAAADLDELVLLVHPTGDQTIEEAIREFARILSRAGVLV